MNQEHATLGPGRPTRRRPAVILAGLSTAALAPALLLPFVTLRPALGDPLVTAVIEYLQPGAMAPQRISVVDGIGRAASGGDVAVGLILFACSVVAPICKLCLVWLMLGRPDVARTSRLGRWLDLVGPFGLVDVMVVSMLVCVWKKYPGGTRLEPGPALYCYVVAVVAGVAANHLARRGGPAPTAARSHAEYGETAAVPDRR